MCSMSKVCWQNTKEEVSLSNSDACILLFSKNATYRQSYVRAEHGKIAPAVMNACSFPSTPLIQLYMCAEHRSIPLAVQNACCQSCTPSDCCKALRSTGSSTTKPCFTRTLDLRKSFELQQNAAATSQLSSGIQQTSRGMWVIICTCYLSGLVIGCFANALSANQRCRFPSGCAGLQTPRHPRHIVIAACVLGC